MDPGPKESLEFKESIVKGWKDPEHLRRRIRARHTDVDYPVLSDLNNFIQKNGTNKNITILDYGAGSSPYRVHFPNADYRRADILRVDGLHYEIGSDSLIAAPAETFDLILSTQVLEHVENVHAYLAESFRLLKKGGALLLTTHGTWEEHGVPQDFQRWTESGLRRDLSIAGYHEATIFKLTCGLRAALYLFITSLFSTEAPASQPSKLLFKVFRTFISRVFPWLYRVCDSWWQNDRIVESGETTRNTPFYLVIATIARK